MRASKLHPVHHRAVLLLAAATAFALLGGACVGVDTPAPQTSATLAEATTLTEAEVDDGAVFVMLDNTSEDEVIVDFFVQGVEQHIAVPPSKLLPLRFGCVDSIRFVGLKSLDSQTGVLLDQMPLNSELTSPEHFDCGDIVMVAIGPEQIELSVVRLANPE